MKAFKRILCTVLVVGVALSAPYARAQDMSDPDLELVRQYFAAHHSPAKKAIYITLLAGGAGAGFVGTAIKMKSPAIAGLIAAPILYYWVRNMVRVLHPTHKESIFLDDNFGLPAGMSLEATKTEFTPEEVERVQAYVEANRHWLFKGTPYWINMGLGAYLKDFGTEFGFERAMQIIFKGSLPQRLATVTGILIFVDSLNLLLFGSKHSPSGKFIESAIGVPPADAGPTSDFQSLDARKPSEIVEQLVSLPPADANRLIKADPEAERALRLTAEVVRQVQAQ